VVIVKKQVGSSSLEPIAHPDGCNLQVQTLEAGVTAVADIPIRRLTIDADLDDRVIGAVFAEVKASPALSIIDVDHPTSPSKRALTRNQVPENRPTQFLIDFIMPQYKAKSAENASRLAIENESRFRWHRVRHPTGVQHRIFVDMIPPHGVEHSFHCNDQ
jgi:hypothetical protein